MVPDDGIIQGSCGGKGQRGTAGEAPSGSGVGRDEGALELGVAPQMGLEGMVDSGSKSPKKSGAETSDVRAGTECQDTCFPWVNSSQPWLHLRVAWGLKKITNPRDSVLIKLL